MKRNLKKLLLLNSILFFLFSLDVICFAQQAKIDKITSITEDKVEFQIYFDKPSVDFRQDLIVNYSVKNNNRKTVFLVVETPTLLQVKDTWFIETLEPVRFPNHLDSNYKFVRIDPKKTFNGKLTLDAKQFTPKPGKTFTGGFLRVGFSYIFDISSLLDCKDSLKCQSELYKNAKSLTVGDLAFDVIYK